MSEFAPWSLDILAWIATYTIHSTLMIGSVALLIRLRQGISPTSRDLLWKVALVGPLATTSLQIGLGVGGVAGHFALSSGETAAAIASPAPPPPQAPPPPPAPRLEQPPQRLIFADAGSVAVFSVPSHRPVAVAEPPAAWTPPAAPMMATAVTVADTDTNTGDGPLSPALAALVLGALGFGSALSLGLFIGRLRDLRRLLRGRRAAVEDPALEFFLELTSELRGGKSMRLSTTDTITSPVALVRREVCLPTRALEEGVIPPTELRAMLAHEVAHLVRRDPEWLTATALFEAVFFFQPLLRLVRRRMVDNTELLCDAWARERTGDGLALAKCIERVASWLGAGQAPLASAMARPRSPVVDRIRRLVMPADRRTLAAPQRIGLGLVILSALAWLAPGVSAAHNQALSPIPEATPEADQPCPYGSAPGACESWHATLVGDPVDDGWNTMMFNANTTGPFAMAALASQNTTSARRSRRQAERTVRKAERRTAKVDRERRRLAAEIHRADDEARRATTRARKLEAEARRLEHRHAAPTKDNFPGLHVRVGQSGPEACADDGHAKSDRLLRITHGSSSAPNVILELDLDDLDDLKRLGDVDVEELGRLVGLERLVDPEEIERIEGLAGLERLAKLSKIEGLEELKGLEIDLDHELAAAIPALTRGVKALEAEILHELEDAEVINSAQMRRTIERELGKAEREVLREIEGIEGIDGAQIRREIERELRKVEREQAQAARSSARQAREAHAKAKEAKAKAKAKTKKEASKSREKAEKRARKAEQKAREAEQRAR